MPVIQPSRLAVNAIAKFKRMRRLKQSRMPAFTLSALGAAADVAAAQIGLEKVLRQGDALLQKLDAKPAEHKAVIVGIDGGERDSVLGMAVLAMADRDRQAAE